VSPQMSLRGTDSPSERQRGRARARPLRACGWGGCKAVYTAHTHTHTHTHTHKHTGYARQSTQPEQYTCSVAFSVWGLGFGVCSLKSTLAVWLFQVCINLKCDEHASMDLRGASSARLVSQRDSNCCRSCVTRLLPNHVETHPSVYMSINTVFIRLYHLTQYM
jgi:hypothetical protein